MFADKLFQECISWFELQSEVIIHHAVICELSSKSHNNGQLPGRARQDRNQQDNQREDIKGILPKGPYLPCVSMAGRALLAGYHRPIESLIEATMCQNWANISPMLPASNQLRPIVDTLQQSKIQKDILCVIAWNYLCFTFIFICSYAFCLSYNKSQ